MKFKDGDRVRLVKRFECGSNFCHVGIGKEGQTGTVEKHGLSVILDDKTYIALDSFTRKMFEPIPHKSIEDFL